MCKNLEADLSKYEKRSFVVRILVCGTHQVLAKLITRALLGPLDIATCIAAGDIPAPGSVSLSNNNNKKNNK